MPDGVVPHSADVATAERQWVGPVPITRSARTVVDVATAHGDAALVAEAIRCRLSIFDQVAPLLARRLSWA